MQNFHTVNITNKTQRSIGNHINGLSENEKARENEPKKNVIFPFTRIPIE